MEFSRTFASYRQDGRSHGPLFRILYEIEIILCCRNRSHYLAVIKRKVAPCKPVVLGYATFILHIVPGIVAVHEVAGGSACESVFNHQVACHLKLHTSGHIEGYFVENLGSLGGEGHHTILSADVYEREVEARRILSLLDRDGGYQLAVAVETDCHGFHNAERKGG